MFSVSHAFWIRFIIKQEFTKKFDFFWLLYQWAFKCFIEWIDLYWWITFFNHYQVTLRCCKILIKLHWTLFRVTDSFTWMHEIESLWNSSSSKSYERSNLNGGIERDSGWMFNLEVKYFVSACANWNWLCLIDLSIHFFIKILFHDNWVKKKKKSFLKCKGRNWPCIVLQKKN